jgi:hypothetical protein
VSNWYSDFNGWVRQMKDVSSLGIPSSNPYAGIGGSNISPSAQQVLGYLHGVNRKAAEVKDLSTLLDPAAQARVEAIRRQFEQQAQFTAGLVEQLRVRNSTGEAWQRQLNARIEADARLNRQGWLDWGRWYAQRGDYAGALAAIYNADYYARVAQSYRPQR